MYKVGDKIKILNIQNEPKYVNKTGVILYIGRDLENELYYRGTWGSCHIYPFIDDIELCME